MGEVARSPEQGAGGGGGVGRGGGGLAGFPEAFDVWGAGRGDAAFAGVIDVGDLVFVVDRELRGGEEEDVSAALGGVEEGGAAFG